MGAEYASPAGSAITHMGMFEVKGQV
jgi:hypothetical protein